MAFRNDLIDMRLSNQNGTQPFAYIVKPYNKEELRFTIENTLIKYRAAKERDRLIARLETALQEVKRLSGLLPICAGCKKIRDREGGWHPIEEYIASHSEADFTHGICPECTRRLYPELENGDDKTKPPVKHKASP